MPLSLTVLLSELHDNDGGHAAHDHRQRHGVRGTCGGDDAARRCERVTTRTWGFWVGAEVWIGTWSGDRVGYYSLP
jgi:hypothetical protein